MPYQSPLHLLDGLAIRPDELTPTGITQLKKKLLAEFNLTPDITLAVGDRSYTKDEVLRTVDQLRDIQNLDEHAAIFSEKSLLTWLENPAQDAFPAEVIQHRQRAGLSPYFGEILADALQTHLGWLLRQRRFGPTQEPLAVALALPPHQQDGVLSVLYEFLDEVIGLVATATEKPNEKRDRETFDFIVYDDWPAFLNRLPSEGFQDLIETFCVQAINYVALVQHHYRAFGYEITYQLANVRCNESLRQTIRGNLSVLTDNYHLPPGQVQREESESNGHWWVLSLIVVVIRILVACGQD